MLILGLSGKKQTGKSTTFGYIQKLCPDKKVKEFALAESLKDGVIATFGIPCECCYGSDEDKNRPLFTWGLVSGKLRVKYGMYPDAPLTGRELLQLVGTDMFREGFNGDIWVELCISKIKQSDADIAVISDVRFPNELQAVRSLGGKVIRIHRNIDIGNSIQHKSETALDDTPNSEFDYVIDNNGTLDDLALKVASITLKEQV